jgi:Isochorismatase family
MRLRTRRVEHPAGSCSQAELSQAWRRRPPRQFRLRHIQRRSTIFPSRLCSRLNSILQKSCGCRPRTYRAVIQVALRRWRRAIGGKASRARQLGSHNQDGRRSPEGQELYLIQLGRLFGLPSGLPAEHLRRSSVRDVGRGSQLVAREDCLGQRDRRGAPGEIPARRQPLYEKALQTAFVGTDFPLELARKRIQVIVLTGIHLDWCIEGNARAARDWGYLPIVRARGGGRPPPSRRSRKR